LGDEYERSIQIDAAVEEALTGRRQNTTFEVMMHKYKYKMEFIKTSEYFKPGLKYTAFVSVLVPCEGSSLVTFLLVVGILQF
jgi:CD109 antigen